MSVGVNEEPQMDSLWALDILFSFVGWDEGDLQLVSVG